MQNMSPIVKLIAGDFRFVDIAFMIVAMRWPDRALPRLLFSGFPIMVVIAESGVFKPNVDLSEPDPEELLRDYKRLEKSILGKEAIK